MRLLCCLLSCRDCNLFSHSLQKEETVNAMNTLHCQHSTLVPCAQWHFYISISSIFSFAYFLNSCWRRAYRDNGAKSVSVRAMSIFRILVPHSFSVTNNTLKKYKKLPFYLFGEQEKEKKTSNSHTYDELSFFFSRSSMGRSVQRALMLFVLSFLTCVIFWCDFVLT